MLTISLSTYPVWPTEYIQRFLFYFPDAQHQIKKKSDHLQPAYIWPQDKIHISAPLSFPPPELSTWLSAPKTLICLLVRISFIPICYSILNLGSSWPANLAHQPCAHWHDGSQFSSFQLSVLFLSLLHTFLISLSLIISVIFHNVWFLDLSSSVGHAFFSC